MYRTCQYDVKNKKSSSGTVVCGVDDLDDGQMKEVELLGNKILLIRENATSFHALGAKCTHYGAPLCSGSFLNGRVRCPWHGACFNVETGDIEDFPGLDSIPKFDVVIEGDQVIVMADKKVLEIQKRTKPMSCAVKSVKQTVLIVGGGPAGLVCAETLRQEQFQGEVIIVTKEKYLPYDRPKLSKALNITAEQITLRDKKFFKDNQIHVKLEDEAMKVNIETKTVSFKEGRLISYDFLVLATGTSPNCLTEIKGHDLKNVMTLRTVDDARLIAKESESKDVFILGASFIGVELAVAMADKAKSVSLIGSGEAPFHSLLGKEVGNAVKKLLVEKNVKFHFQTTISEFVGGIGGMLKGVVLTDGSKLSADLCVLGVGSFPSTDFVKYSGINITNKGFIPVNKQMETNAAGVYAVGDITQFPLFMAGDQSVNIQHWQMAHQQGRIAALNILGKATNIRSVPFFWTHIGSKSLRYTGYGYGYDDIIIDGNLEDLKFVAYYTKGDYVVAVATMNSDPFAAQAADFFLSGQKLTKAEIEENPTGWTVKLKRPVNKTHM